MERIHVVCKLITCLQQIGKNACSLQFKNMLSTAGKNACSLQIKYMLATAGKNACSLRFKNMLATAGKNAWSLQFKNMLAAAGKNASLLQIRRQGMTWNLLETWYGKKTFAVFIYCMRKGQELTVYLYTVCI